jgi:hypothetical protein
MHHHNRPRPNSAKTIITALTPQLQQSYNSILNELHDYTLTQPFMDNALSLQVNIHSGHSFSSISSISSFKSVKEPKPTVPPSIHSDAPPPVQVAPLAQSLKPDLLIPSQKDTLFWCFYIMKHGLNAYTTIGNKHFQIEQEEKIAAIEFLRTKKDVLKTHKIKPFTSIESDLSPGNSINIKTFFALAICYDLPVIYIYKNTYVDNLDVNDDVNNVNNGSSPHIIQWTRPNEYAFVYDPSQWSSLCSTKYKWQSIDKPVGPASLYKITDILELFNKLQIPTNNANTVFHLAKKPTKKEMYDAILAYFM